MSFNALDFCCIAVRGETYSLGFGTQTAFCLCLCHCKEAAFVEPPLFSSQSRKQTNMVFEVAKRPQGGLVLPQALQT